MKADVRRRRWHDDEGVHLDVRGLPPPEPMVMIMAAIDAGVDGDAIVVHHERDPVFLYPELSERGWFAPRVDGEPGEVRLKLVRAG